jgi:hypothetical protein
MQLDGRVGTLPEAKEAAQNIIDVEKIP